MKTLNSPKYFGNAVGFVGLLLDNVAGARRAPLSTVGTGSKGAESAGVRCFVRDTNIGEAYERAVRVNLEIGVATVVSIPDLIAPKARRRSTWRP